MKAVSVWNQKGGVGKTTLSLQIAGYFAKVQKKSVLIIDLDPQTSCYEIFEIGKLNFDVITKMPSAKPTQDIIIIDHPPGTQTLPKTKRVLVPFQPSILSYKAAARSFVFLKKSNKTVIKVLSCVDARKAEHRAVQAQLQKQKQNIFTVCSRSIYERSINKGMTVFHSEIANLYGINKAKNEIGYLGSKLFNNK